MGFFGRLFGFDTFDAAQRVLAEPYEPFMGTGGIPVVDPGSPLELMLGDRSQTEQFWRSQPNLRKVVDFVARNVASIPLHLYDRESDTERLRVTDHQISHVLRTPQRRVGAYRFWHSVLSDGLLYDRWCVLKAWDKNDRLELVQVPSWRLRIDVDPLRRVTALRYWQGDRVGGDHPEWVDIDLDEAIFDFGYAPRTAGLTPVRTLRDVLDESAEAVRYRRDVWENGARMPGYISRPADTPQSKWTPEQRDRFAAHMRAVYGKDGTNAGGMPVLEDGMTIQSTDVFSPQDANDLEGRRLSAIEVAAAFHIAPELVGAQQGNYSNVREFRQMLYRDSLGPYIKAWEDALNAQLVADLAGADTTLYVEANVESKLRGSFEEQAQVMQSATGAPWMTRNEARAMQNRAPIDGGDDLVVPLNVLAGGQASPQDSGSQNEKPKSREVHTKARANASHDEKARQVVADFFKRQESAVSGRLRLKAEADWWDGPRWDAELADDLYRLSVQTATQVGRASAERMGFDPGDYDEDRTLAFLRKAAESDAANINATTRDAIEKALGEEAPDESVPHVFEVAKTSRSEQIATTVITGLSAFAVTEVGRQLGRGAATKTWVTAGRNPRPSHSALHGTTVPIDEPFPNGLMWPGAPGAVDEVAGCTCEVNINIPEEG